MLSSLRCWSTKQSHQCCHSDVANLSAFDKSRSTGHIVIIIITWFNNILHFLLIHRQPEIVSAVSHAFPTADQYDSTRLIIPKSATEWFMFFIPCPSACSGCVRRHDNFIYRSIKMNWTDSVFEINVSIETTRQSHGTIMLYERRVLAVLVEVNIIILSRRNNICY